MRRRFRIRLSLGFVAVLGAIAIARAVPLEYGDTSSPGKTLSAFAMMVLNGAGKAISWPGTQSSVALDVGSVTTGGSAVNALSAGHCVNGCRILTANAAGICVNWNATAATTTTGGLTECVGGGQGYNVPPTNNAVSVNSTASSVTLSGWGTN